MSLSVACALVLVGIIATCFCEPIDFKTCEGSPNSIKQVNITPCAAQPCVFHYNTTVTVAVTFNSTMPSENLTAEIYGIVAGIPVKFRMPNSNGCNGCNIECPIKSSSSYTYSGVFQVLSAYPKIELVVQWDLLSDAKKYLFCFLFPMSIQ